MVCMLVPNVTKSRLGEICESSCLVCSASMVCMLVLSLVDSASMVCMLVLNLTKSSLGQPCPYKKSQVFEKSSKILGEKIASKGIWEIPSLMMQYYQNDKSPGLAKPKSIHIIISFIFKPWYWSSQNGSPTNCLDFNLFLPVSWHNTASTRLTCPCQCRMSQVFEQKSTRLGGKNCIKKSGWMMEIGDWCFWNSPDEKMDVGVQFSVFDYCFIHSV